MASRFYQTLCTHIARRDASACAAVIYKGSAECNNLHNGPFSSSAAPSGGHPSHTLGIMEEHALFFPPALHRSGSHPRHHAWFWWQRNFLMAAVAPACRPCFKRSGVANRLQRSAGIRWGGIMISQSGSSCKQHGWRFLKTLKP